MWMSISVDKRYKHNSHYCLEAKSERDYIPMAAYNFSQKEKLTVGKPAILF